MAAGSMRRCSSAAMGAVPPYALAPAWDGAVRAYPQVALTFALRHERPHDGRVRELLLPAGPLALLPIGKDCRR